MKQITGVLVAVALTACGSADRSYEDLCGSSAPEDCAAGATSTDVASNLATDGGTTALGSSAVTDATVPVGASSGVDATADATADGTQAPDAATTAPEGSTEGAADASGDPTGTADTTEETDDTSTEAPADSGTSEALGSDSGAETTSEAPADAGTGPFGQVLDDGTLIWDWLAVDQHGELAVTIDRREALVVLEARNVLEAVVVYLPQVPTAEVNAARDFDGIAFWICGAGAAPIEFLATAGVNRVDYFAVPVPLGDWHEVRIAWSDVVPSQYVGNAAQGDPFDVEALRELGFYFHNEGVAAVAGLQYFEADRPLTGAPPVGNCPVP